jgi:hypothetical protein
MERNLWNSDHTPAASLRYADVPVPRELLEYVDIGNLSASSQRTVQVAAHDCQSEKQGAKRANDNTLIMAIMLPPFAGPPIASQISV